MKMKTYYIEVKEEWNMNIGNKDWMTYEDRLNYGYRMAQATMGIKRVLQEQIKVVGFKGWSDMKNDEKSTLLFSLRRIWARENKKSAHV